MASSTFQFTNLRVSLSARLHHVCIKSYLLLTPFTLLIISSYGSAREEILYVSQCCKYSRGAESVTGALQDVCGE